MFGNMNSIESVYSTFHDGRFLVVRFYSGDIMEFNYNFFDIETEDDIKELVEEHYG